MCRVALITGLLGAHFAVQAAPVAAESEVNAPQTASKEGDAFALTAADEKICEIATLISVSRDTQAIFAQYSDCVVKVLGTRDETGSAPLVYGTGFFIDPQGHVLTTATVASEATQLWVQCGAISYAATMIGQDPRTNLAVLQLVTLPKGAHYIALPMVSKILKRHAGELCVAISSTKGMSVEPKLGMITGRDLVYGEHILALGYFRSSLEICGGESGSPVFDSTGRFCGIMIAALPDIRSSFIIPAEALKRVADRLCAGLEVDYAAAGFCVQGQMSVDGQKELVISLSERPGLRVGDKVCSIDDVEIQDEEDIADILFFKSPGECITVTVDRPEVGRISVECMLKARVEP
ncbi:MAG: S1C family serine protease [Verrucomicrobiota bacterium]|nr:MAG: S1C family serine protease [Verrucomicrobiota bacterium]